MPRRTAGLTSNSTAVRDETTSDSTNGDGERGLSKQQFFFGRGACATNSGENSNIMEKNTDERKTGRIDQPYRASISTCYQLTEARSLNRNPRRCSVRVNQTRCVHTSAADEELGL